MEGSSTDSLYAHKDICDLKHKSVDEKVDELTEQVESITNPSNGHIAIAVSHLEKKIEKVDAKLNGLIIFYITTVTGLAISIGGEFLKKLVK